MRSLMNTDYNLRLERGQNEQKSILWMNVVLVASLLAGMVFPMADSDVQAKQKKVLVAYFSATGTTKSAASKIKSVGEGRKGAKWSESYGFFRSRCGKMGKEESEIMGEKVRNLKIQHYFNKNIEL